MANYCRELQLLDRKLAIIFLLGLLLSLYGLFVEIRHDYDRSYKAMCDLSSTVSCSAAFLSDYGKGFGILPQPLAFKNPYFGLALYLAQLVLLVYGKCLRYSMVLLATTIFANLGSIFLGYILFAVLKVACVVCISLYVVNLFALIYSINRYRITAKLHQINLSKRQS